MSVVGTARHPARRTAPTLPGRAAPRRAAPRRRPALSMALLTQNGLDGLLTACETLEAGDFPDAAVVRAPRTARVVKRRVEAVEEAPPARAPVAKRPKSGPVGPSSGKAQPPPAGGGARAPRSPDEKRKLSRQMAAFMRYGVLVLPADVKVRNSSAVSAADSVGAAV